MDKLFRIGEMAKLFHMSMSTLRHYERLGLLKPEKVDEKTGYRYYSVRQFEALNTVRFRGSHTEAPEQYRRLAAFWQEQGWRAGGFSREVTMIDYGITNDPEKFVTEISIPIQR